MANRSKFIAVAAGAVGVGAAIRARRHARLEHAAEGIADAIMPSVTEDIPREPEPVVDEAHAPGHQHLAWPSEAGDDKDPGRLRERPWTKRAHNRRRPIRG